MSHLLTPGPVPIPPEVANALQKPVIPHRSQAFEAFYGRLLNKLKAVFMTKGAIATMIGSGTYGLEAAMYSLFSPGENILVVNMGKFSGRWASYGPLLGLEVQTLDKPWGEAPSPEEVLALVSAHSDIKGVVLTHCETSTGALLDVEECAFRLRREHPEVLILADVVSTLGVLPFYFDDWGLDMAVTASQKGLRNPAGVAVAAASERALAAMQTPDPSDFRHWGNYFRAAEKNSYPYTPPVTLLFGLEAAADVITRETLPITWNRSHACSRLFKAGIEALGAEILGQPPSDALTAFRFPDQDHQQIKDRLAKSGFLLAGGQGPWAGEILRVSHMAGVEVNVMAELLREIERLLGR